MIEIKHVTHGDKEFWFSLDAHLSEEEFEAKIGDKRGYVLFEDGTPIALMRYNLFWDNTPFCTMLYVRDDHQCRGFGRQLIEHWENEMKSKGFGMVMTSTQVDEQAQHFYRKLGYKDCGGFVLDIPGFEQPMEMIMVKGI